MNIVALAGRLSRDPDTHRNGDSVNTRFSIAVGRKYKDENGEYKADFPSCVAFGKTAEFIDKYFKKGMAIGIRGRIQTGSYTNKDGNKVYTTDVVVDEAEFTESKSASGNNGQQTAPPPLPPSTQPPMNQAQQAQAMPPQYQAPPQQYYQPQPQAMSQQAQQPVFQQGDPEWMKVPEGSPSELPFD